MDGKNNQQVQSDRLLFFGILLLLVGLISGLFIPVMTNPRMGLSAHLEGMMNGMLLVIVGLIWNKLIVNKRYLFFSYWLLLYASFANYIAVTIAAITGAGKMMPISGGKDGPPIIESLISFLLISLSLAMIFACVIILIGLRRYISGHSEKKISS
ncbi:MAG: hydrogenase [Bacteroidetes bacterium]|nr:MAG: hydrogenase [Bacteroidota bacterium]